jgi:hypothetical protein
VTWLFGAFCEGIQKLRLAFDVLRQLWRSTKGIGLLCYIIVHCFVLLYESGDESHIPLLSTLCTSNYSWTGKEVVHDLAAPSVSMAWVCGALGSGRGFLKGS